MQRILPIGDVIIELSVIDSTNNYAMRLINEGMAEHGIVIRADYQTNGKGQHGNVWQAEESKNLLFSAIVDSTALQLSEQFYLNAAVCLSVAEMLMMDFNIPNVSIKWPNDIYAENKKIAGILIENNIRGTIWSNAIVGIGLNVNQTEFEDLNRACSMNSILQKQFKIKNILKHLLVYINKNILLLYQQKEILFKRYNENLLFVNSSILFKRKNETHKGKLLGVNTQSQIEILVDDKIKKYNHKEIELIFS